MTRGTEKKLYIAASAGCLLSGIIYFINDKTVMGFSMLTLSFAWMAIGASMMSKRKRDD